MLRYTYQLISRFRRFNDVPISDLLFSNRYVVKSNISKIAKSKHP